MEPRVPEEHDAAKPVACTSADRNDEAATDYVARLQQEKRQRAPSNRRGPGAVLVSRTALEPVATDGVMAQLKIQTRR